MTCPFEMVVMTYKSIAHYLGFFFSFFPEGAIVTHEKWSGLQRKVGPRFVATRVPRTGA